MQVTLYRDNTAETASLSHNVHCLYESCLRTISIRLSIINHVLGRLFIAKDLVSEEGLKYRPGSNYFPFRRLKGFVLLYMQEQMGTCLKLIAIRFYSL